MRTWVTLCINEPEQKIYEMYAEDKGFLEGI